MGRYIREAGGIPCGSNLAVANVLVGANTTWWSTWNGGIEGYDDNDNNFPQAIGTGVGDRLADTDAIFILSGSINPATRITDHDASAFRIELSDTNATEAGELLMACDYTQAAIFQVSAAAANDRNIFHNVGVGLPSNCSAGLGFPSNCASVTGTPKVFSNNGFVTPLSATAWYVGNNSRGGSSLFRVSLEHQGTTVTPLTEEVAEGIIDLQIEYLETTTGGILPTDYVDASGVTDWGNVVAARLTVTLETLDPMMNGTPLVRRWYTVYSLRNRAT
jgi:type IV pilus assembly protein PilW